MKPGDMVYQHIPEYVYKGLDTKREAEVRHVKLMATSGMWAMVRRPGCMPYVCEIKQLREES